MEKMFKVKDLEIVSRMYYESLPCAMYACEFDDTEMQIIADAIYSSLINDYGYGIDAEEYFRNPSLVRRLNNTLYEDIDDAFWKEMEEVAVNMGMQYYADMTDEEYNSIKMK